MATDILTCNDIQLEEELELLEINLAKIDKWVNGTETETVKLGGVDTDTIRKLVKTYWRTATKSRLGVVQIGDGLNITVAGLLSVAYAAGSGISLNDKGELTIDPSAWSEELTAKIMSQIRVPFWLSKNTTWYVNAATGSDNNSGLTPATAFKTIQKAISYICDNINLSGYNATISVSAGTYSIITTRKYNSSGGIIRIAGSGKDISFITVSNSRCINSENNSGTYDISGFTLEETTTLSQSSIYGCVYSESGVSIILSDLKCIQNEPNASIASQAIVRSNGGSVSIGQNVEMIANGLSSGSNLYALFSNNRGTINVERDLSINGTLNTTASATNVSIIQRGANLPVITGTVTGKRWSVSANAIIRSNGGGENYFPGSIAGGPPTSGGQYL